MIPSQSLTAGLIRFEHGRARMQRGSRSDEARGRRGTREHQRTGAVRHDGSCQSHVGISRFRSRKGKSMHSHPFSAQKMIACRSSSYTPTTIIIIFALATNSQNESGYIFVQKFKLYRCSNFGSHEHCRKLLGLTTVLYYYSLFCVAVWQDFKFQELLSNST